MSVFGVRKGRFKSGKVRRKYFISRGGVRL